MPEKAKKEDSFDKVKSFLSDIFMKNVVSTLKDQFDFYLGKVQNRVYETEKGVIKRLMAAGFLLVGFIFISLSVVYYLIEVLFLQKTFSFFIVGILLILISLIMKITMFSKSK